MFTCFGLLYLLFERAFAILNASKDISKAEQSLAQDSVCYMEAPTGDTTDLLICNSTMFNSYRLKHPKSYVKILVLTLEVVMLMSLFHRYPSQANDVPLCFTELEEGDILDMSHLCGVTEEERADTAERQ
ncbi:MAG: hypothetical protein F6K19_47250 [Cyanothece sp. SIO1E1]|nr:hypothetical protein [Cyanothece sp. SIO1E1]